MEVLSSRETRCMLVFGLQGVLFDLAGTRKCRKYVTEELFQILGIEISPMNRIGSILR